MLDPNSIEFDGAFSLGSQKRIHLTYVYCLQAGTLAQETLPRLVKKPG